MLTTLCQFCTVMVVLISIFYLISTWKFNYWKKKKVPHLKPVPLFGNYKDYILLREINGKVAQRICQAFPTAPYIGSYFGTEPALLIQDPKLIQLITVKDFPYFNGREISKYNDREIVMRNMFFSHGDRWKVVRQNMSPLFTASKIRCMFPLVQHCAREFDEMLERIVSANSGLPLDVQDLVSRFTMDSIVSSGFGVESNTMTDFSKDNPFYKTGKLIFENSYLRGICLVVRVMWPCLFYGLGLQVFPAAITDFFSKILTGVFESRNYEPSNRNDFVDMVLSLRNCGYITSESMMVNETRSKSNKVMLKVDNDFLIAQCVLFFAGGFESSATTMCFTLFELAKDIKSQERAAEEIDKYLKKHGGQIDYDCVTELPFLDACMDEAMRLYPVSSILTREVMADYTLPDGLRLEKGLRVHLPVYHLHRHPEHFPEPDQFRPERFLPENKHNIKPYTYLPFGEGHRMCVGIRFGKMQTLSGLITVLHKYRVELPPGVPKDIIYDATAFMTNPKGGFPMILVPRFPIPYDIST